MGKKIIYNGIEKECHHCHIIKPLEEFHKGNSLGRRQPNCKICQKLKYDTPERLRKITEYKRNKRHTDEAYRLADNENTRLNLKKHIENCLFRAARHRAKYRNLEFTITLEDIVIPKICPLLEIELKKEDWKASDNSYSLDRIDNTKGYIKGNVWVISRKANLIKNNASLADLEKIIKNLKNKLQ